MPAWKRKPLNVERVISAGPFQIAQVNGRQSNAFC